MTGLRALVLIFGVWLIALPARAEGLRTALRPPMGPQVPERVLIATPTPGSLATVSGLHLRSCDQGICTAEAWPEALDRAALEGRVVLIERSGVRRPLLERSLPAAGVTEWVRSSGFDGEGALIAVIDSGIDWHHPDFTREGRTRIEALVDLSLPPAGLHPELEAEINAAVWLREDIEAHLTAEAAGEQPTWPVTSRDTFGHGTHVASIAAGELGVAPGAGLLIVRASREERPVVFDDADVLETARLVFDLAAELERPCVLVLSLGGHEGPHDGTSLLERGLSELVGEDHPGRAIVVAAGNSGGCQDHAGGDLEGGDSEVALEVGLADESLAVDIEIWSGAGTGLAVEIRTPGGDRLGPLEQGDELARGIGDAWIGASNAPDGPDPINNDLRVAISLRRQLAGPIEPGVYRLILSGEGRFDAYLNWTSSRQSHGAARFLTGLEPDGTLTVPATAPELIAVGATVSRVGWVDETGRSWRDDRYRPGELAAYSGSGPTRGGALKPDLVAPGHVIAAAMGRDAEAGDEWSAFTPSSFFPDRYLVVSPGTRAVLWGTSLAAPHVAGAAALLFQADPNLTQDQVRSLLVASARADGGAGLRAWSPRWGYGELDAEAALRLLAEGFAEEVSGRTSSIGVASDVLRPSECTDVTATPRDDEGWALGPGHRVELLVDGDPASVMNGGADGVYRGRWCAGEPLGAEVVLSAEIDGVEIDGEVVVRVARGRRWLGGWATARGGGCTTGGASNGSGLFSLVIRSFVGA